jgi:hypothetical protein
MAIDLRAWPNPWNGLRNPKPASLEGGANLAPKFGKTPIPAFGENLLKLVNLLYF